MKLTLHSAVVILENKLLDRPTDILTTSLTDRFETQLYGLCGVRVGAGLVEDIETRGLTSYGLPI